MELSFILQDLMRSRGEDFLARDPLRFPHAYSGRDDREIAAFLSAALAYGRAAMIGRNLAELFARMPEGPSAFVHNCDPREASKRLRGFRHRFNSGEDLACLCWILGQMRREAGSLEAYFLAGDDSSLQDVGPALDCFARRALERDFTPFFGQSALPAASGVRYFFPSPSGGSACKRLCMLLRWLCRPDDGIDLGLWKGVDPSRLVLPLDTHTARISRLLGFSGRRSADWKMALEVTAALRRMDPSDPVRFDFALSHLGISDGCTGKKGQLCRSCPIKGLCSANKGLG